MTVTQQTATDYSALVSTLDLRTKVTLLTGATAFTLAPEDSIGLGELRLSDGPTGVRGLKFTGGRQVTLFPNATLLASAWSTDTAYEVGRMLAEEAMAQQIHVVLGPTINLHRSPLGGRLFEAYSEDPLLTGKLAAAYVRGLQDLGIGACLKHLIGNESETDRNSMNSIIDETTLRELYLLPFEIAVQESDAWSMMAAYNDVNGVTATEQHHVQNEIVKGEWGYRGLIMSDWFATKSAGPAANGGLDLVMPGPIGPWGDALIAAVESGEVAEDVIDDHLERLLLLADRTGALGELRSYPTHLPSPDSARRRAQLTRLAAAGMTVLTNNGALPLNTEQTVALIGRHAVQTIDMGGGSAQVNPPYQISIDEGLKALLGEKVSVTDGVSVRNRAVVARFGTLVDPDTGQAGVRFVLRDGHGNVLQELVSAPGTVMVGFDDDYGTPVASVDFRARINGSGSMDIGGFGVGAWSFDVGTTHFEYVLAGGGYGVTTPGSDGSGDPEADGSDGSPEADGGGGAVDGSSVVGGDAILRPPSNPDTVNIDPDTEISGTVQVVGGLGLFGLIAQPTARPVDEVIAEAVAAAAAADVAVVVVGLTEEQETESADKNTLELPGAQNAMVFAVAAAARRTVVVVNSATPVIMPWLGEVDAVLWAGLPGQEGGHAVAAALLGLIEPAGRLVTTFPVADDASPAWNVTPIDGAIEYSEGTYIGYRGHYAHHAPEPAFWMGHGLGYATWEYSDSAVNSGSDDVSVSLQLRNTSTRDSREVVQLYFEPAETDQPIRLVGWTDVQVAAGGRVPVTVAADRRLWRRWEEKTQGWEWLSGAGRLLVARGLGDIRASLDI